LQLMIICMTDEKKNRPRKPKMAVEVLIFKSHSKSER